MGAAQQRGTAGPKIQQLEPKGLLGANLPGVGHIYHRGLDCEDGETGDLRRTSTAGEGADLQD